MKNMKTKSAIAALALTLGIATVAYALPHNAFETTYYATAAKNTVVGNDFYDCGPEIYRSGQQTAFKETIVWGTCRHFTKPGETGDPFGFVYDDEDSNP